MLYVAYYRVSTQKQGLSGLGIEAQQEAVRQFLREDDQLIEAFTEVETGRVKERPRLQEAMALCRSRKATLLIAKLDRLSRNLAFIAALMEDRTLQFKACDNPTADRTFMGMLAVFAEHEARAISDRTKAALAAAKKRGVKLGGWRGHSISSNATAMLKRNAAKRAEDVMPAIRKAQAAGITTYKGIAKVLNEEGVSTARESTWRAAQVRRVIARAATECGQQSSGQACPDRGE